MLKIILKHKFLFFLINFTLLCMVLYLAQTASKPFSEKFSLTVGAFFRNILGHISGIFGFSLFEIIVFALALYLVFAVFFALIHLMVRFFGKKKIGSLRPIIAIPVAAAILFDMFVLTFSASYYRNTIDENMGLSLEIKEDDVFLALEFLTNEIKRDVSEIKFEKSGHSICESNFSVLSDKINAAFDFLSAQNSFIQRKGHGAKPLLCSKILTYTFISGIFGYFTGEANINTNYPDFVIPYSIAHEFAHQRGIAPENEANFMAFVVCLQSNDPYIRYSGVANVFSNIANTAYALNHERYFEIIEELPKELIGEYNAYNAFMDKYKNTPAGDIANEVNDAYLKSQGQSAGTVSYSLIVELVVSYIAGLQKAA